MFHFQGEEADDDDIYNVLSTLKRLTSFHKYVAFLLLAKSNCNLHSQFYLLSIGEKVWKINVLQPLKY